MQYGTQTPTSPDKALDAARSLLAGVVREKGVGSLYVVLSPMMACEEAHLAITLIRSLDAQAVVVPGPVPSVGEDEVFRHYLTKRETFRIKAEKAPNAAGVRRVMAMHGGPTIGWEEFVKPARPETKKLLAGWIVGGYLSSWLPKDVPAQFKRGIKVVQDILPSPIADSADVLMPAAAWAEKDGCWENFAGRIQAFEAAVPPPEGAMREGEVYHRLLGRTGLYNAADVRREMGEPFTSVSIPAADAQEPAFEFVEL
jgi:hypothetical protein